MYIVEQTTGFCPKKRTLSSLCFVKILSQLNLKIFTCNIPTGILLKCHSRLTAWIMRENYLRPFPGCRFQRSFIIDYIF